MTDDGDGSSMLNLDVDIERLDDVGVQAGYDVCHEPSSYVVVGVVWAGFAALEVLDGVVLGDSGAGAEFGTDRRDTVGNSS